MPVEVLALVHGLSMNELVFHVTHTAPQGREVIGYHAPITTGLKDVPDQYRDRDDDAAEDRLMAKELKFHAIHCRYFLFCARDKKPINHAS